MLKRLDQKIDQRFDALDGRIDAVDRKVDVVDQKVDAVDRKGDAVRPETTTELKIARQETAAEFKAVRNDMAQGFANIRQETTQSFANLEQKMTAEFHITRNDMVKYYSQIDNDAKADKAELRREYNQLLTGMDVMTSNYEQFGHDSAIIDAEHQDLKRDVESLKKRDMEKAAAIEKIEKEIDQLKAA